MHHIFVLLEVVLRPESFGAHLAQEGESIEVVLDAFFSCKHRCPLLMTDCADDFCLVYSLHVSFLLGDGHENTFTEDAGLVFNTWLCG